MIATKRHLDRRTVLRGIGATIALPLLDGMVPAFAAMRNTAAKPITRLGVVYVPNGINMAQWTPTADGTAFEFTRILEPLAPFRDRLVLLSGMENREAAGWPGEGPGEHSRGPAAYLTGVHCKKTEGPDISAGTSMDQIAARELERHTQLGSLELALEANDMMGVCTTGYSCLYSGTISWRSPTNPLPMESNPRAVFERLFGDSGSTDAEVQRRRLQEDRSILDFVAEDISRLDTRLGPGDRRKMQEYVEAVRDIERRIQKAEQHGRELPAVDKPQGIPDSFEEHAKLMFDLMAIAYQADLTRVVTFLMGREVSVRTYPEVGVPEPHHPVSHHGDRPEQLEKNAKINTFHVQLFAHLLERLRSTPEGDGSLLDHSMITYGPGFSDPNRHWPKQVPVVLAGSGAGQIKGGRHIRFPDDRPMTNLHVTLLDKMGVPVERLGDSTGKIDALSL